MDGYYCGNFDIFILQFFNRSSKLDLIIHFTWWNIVQACKEYNNGWKTCLFFTCTLHCLILNQTHVVNNLHICLNDAHMLHFIFIIATTNHKPKYHPNLTSVDHYILRFHSDIVSLNLHQFLIPFLHYYLDWLVKCYSISLSIFQSSMYNHLRILYHQKYWIQAVFVYVH